MVPWWGWAIMAFAGVWTLAMIAFAVILIIIMVNEE